MYSQFNISHYLT